MIWLIAAVLVGALSSWVGLDVVRNRRYVPVPTRPAVRVATEENRLLAVLAARALGDRAAERFIDPAIAETEIDVDATIEAICSWVDSRYDCSDFRLVSLIRILYRYADGLTDAQHARIRRTLLAFKYWLDEPGYDSMCYWSENHQILFASAEYLIGQLHPNAPFSNSGMTGADHVAKGRERVLTWLEQRWRFGFTEWYSNVYYTEDIGPLSNLIDFARDPEIVEKARIVMDLLLLDVATQSFRGTFVSNSGRLYEDGKKAGNTSSMRAIARLLAGVEDRREIDATSAGMGIGFFLCEGYTVPPVIRRIAGDPGPTEIRASNGLDLAELRALGLLGGRDDQIMMQWGMEAFANPEVVNNTIDLVNRHAMQRHEMLYPIGVINVGALRRFGLLPLVTRVLDPQSNGTAIQRSNSYLYRTHAYTMSTSQAHHPGSYGDQQHIWQATLADDLSVFTTHPAVRAGAPGVLGNSPTYWVGSGRLPHSVQHRNVNLTLYRLPARSGLLEAPMLHYTHAWFPEDRFDDLLVDGRRAFGRRGEALIAITAGAPLWYGPEGGYDAKGGDDHAQTTADVSSTGRPREELVQPGRDTWWVTEMSTLDEEGSLAGFASRIAENVAEFDASSHSRAGRLAYTTRGRRLEVVFGGAFTVDGERVRTDYARLDSPYAQVPRDPSVITITAGSDALELDFARVSRVAPHIIEENP